MGTKQDGGPAFPPMHSPDNHPSGMSLRDWFAGQALSCISFGMMKSGYEEGVPPAEIYAGLSRASYGIADAMLAERSKP